MEVLHITAKLTKHLKPWLQGLTCVALQRILLCMPMLTQIDVYYQGQYSTYSLAVHNVSNNTSSMFFWYESVTNRGCKEISLCILKYVTITLKPLSRGQEEKLIVWSDRFTGQNNNWNILKLYQYLITLGYYSKMFNHGPQFLAVGSGFGPYRTC
ncbi:hypothetical protein PR048_004842 [Dryococelus australis]|uniref:Uncharacterized protein n=1 Tax=Dryococelus australis TaxID=614101 RepID=A0ABQ9I6J1_9NEOP|nr:hypothetical protein PR048_004842 [Dryococelus australis]